MTPKLKTPLSIFVMIVLAGLLAYYIYNHLSDFKTLFSLAFTPANILFLVLFVLISISNIFSNGILLDILTSAFGIKLKLRESFGLAMITRFYNYITPFHGGMAARAVYLKKKHKFPYVHFLATLSAIYVIIFLIGSLSGLISIFFIWLYYGLFNYIIFYLFLTIFVFLISIITFSPKLPEAKNKWTNRFTKVINGWHLIKNNKKIIFATALISLIQLFLGAINLIIIYSIFNIPLSFFKALFIASIGSIAILVSLTPGNLGVGDAIAIFSATIIGVGLTEAVAATILGRAISVLVLFTLGPIFSYFLLKKEKTKDLNSSNL